MLLPHLLPRSREDLLNAHFLLHRGLLSRVALFNLFVAPQQIRHIRHRRQDYLYHAFLKQISNSMSHVVSAARAPDQACAELRPLQGDKAVGQGCYITDVELLVERQQLES